MASILKQEYDFIKELINAGISYQSISAQLIDRHGLSKGLSSASVKRFVQQNNFRSRISNEDLEEELKRSVAEVGPTYGRRMMAGYLKGKGVNASDKRIRNALYFANPDYAASRSNDTARLRNPLPYRADYFGQKLHIDQNEKLFHFGVTHIAAIDGYSGFIVGHIIMPVKNNVAIYRDLYIPAVSTYGIWDSIRVDHGREWYLMLAAQDMLGQYRHDTSKPPYCATSSKHNLRIERLWVEINSRINYPLKQVLQDMEDAGNISMDDPVISYCVSTITSRVVAVGIRRHIAAWNNHCIRGRGKPVELAVTSRCRQVPSDVLPAPEDMLTYYRSNGGTITDEWTFGVDPLSDYQDLQQVRENQFACRCSFSLEDAYSLVVNGERDAFVECLNIYIDETRNLSPL